MSGEGQTNAGTRAGLYERLVGEGWGGLDEPVRRFHLCARGVGVFKVRRGEGRLARVVARLMGLPENGEEVPLLLSVEPHGGGERWRREFAGREFVTEQGEHSGLMAERTGPFELRFRLKSEGGSLLYASEGAALRVKSLRVRLPRLLAPRVEAWERADEGGDVRVFVRVTAPLVGPLIRYEGLVKTTEEDEG